MIHAQPQQDKAPKQYELAEYVDFIGWPLYLLWINGGIFFGLFGGFVFLTSLRDSPPPNDIWLFAGAMIVGVIALTLLIFHIAVKMIRPRQVLIFDETTVTTTFGEHSFNFGMTEHMLWDQDYRFTPAQKLDKPCRTKVLVAYRDGNHHIEGQTHSFVFDAWATPRQLAQIQDAYLTLMLVAKSRRKIQRENANAIKQLSASNDLVELSKLLSKLNGPSVIEDANIAASEDPSDKITLTYSKKNRGGAEAATEVVLSGLQSKPVSFIADLCMGFVGLSSTIFNIAILFALFKH